MDIPATAVHSRLEVMLSKLGIFGISSCNTYNPGNGIPSQVLAKNCQVH